MSQVIIFYFQNFYSVGFLNYVYFEFWKVGREGKEKKQKRNSDSRWKKDEDGGVSGYLRNFLAYIWTRGNEVRLTKWSMCQCLGPHACNDSPCTLKGCCRRIVTSLRSSQGCMARHLLKNKTDSIMTYKGKYGRKAIVFYKAPRRIAVSPLWLSPVFTQASCIRYVISHLHKKPETDTHWIPRGFKIYIVMGSWTRHERRKGEEGMNKERGGESKAFHD